MRILFLNPTGRLGGAETALLELMAGLKEQHASWRVGLVAASDGPLISRARALGADVRVLPFPAALARLGDWSPLDDKRSALPLALRCAQAWWPARRYAARLREVIGELAPDIVHTNGLKMHVLGAWAIPPRMPLVWHVHDYIERRPIAARALRRYAHTCSAVVVPSRSVAGNWQISGAALPPVHAIWNAVDLARFRPGGETMDLDDRSRLPAPTGDVVRVGLVATFARWKGHRLFLEAIARLPPTANVRAYVIGDALYDTCRSQVSIQALRAEAARLGLGDRLGFTGFLEDPAPAIRALDILVHASTEPEPFGLTIAEGLACGRAVVVSPEGGVEEITTPGVDTLTFSPRDAGSLANTIAELASDRDLRARLGLAARATAERRFARRRLATEVAAVYERLASPAPLRVLHVHSGNLYGGVETFLATVAREATTEPRMTSSFALCFDGRLSAELTAVGHRPAMLGAVRVSRPHTIWRARRALARRLARQRIDIVVCHQAWAHAIFGRTVRRAGLPLVFWQHTAGGTRHWLDRWARRVTPDLAVASSRFSAGRLARSFPNSRVEAIYCPLKLPVNAMPNRVARESIRRSLDTPRGDLVIVQVGRLDPMKGNRETLEALATLRDLGDWTYWVVGGPQRASDRRYLRELQAIVERHGLGERVRFAGARADVAALLEAADIYCQPNTAPEAFGISLVEAQAAGLPIVTSAIGGALEIVDDTCGRLVPPCDVSALATALRSLLTDAGLRARLGGAARSRCDALCDLQREMTRMHDVLAGAIEQRRPSAVETQAPAIESSVHS